MRPVANVKRKSKRIQGITKDAEALGVTREHLRLVLINKRESRSLLERYRALKADGSKPSATMTTPRFEGKQPGLPQTQHPAQPISKP